MFALTVKAACEIRVFGYITDETLAKLSPGQAQRARELALERDE